MADLTNINDTDLDYLWNNVGTEHGFVRPLIDEIRRHRAAQAADEERVRTVVVDAINSEVCIDNDDVAAIADRVAKQLATAAVRPALPARKEWDCAAHDSGNTQGDYESSDYVDGWNEALDAVPVKP